MLISENSVMQAFLAKYKLSIERRNREESKFSKEN